MTKSESKTQSTKKEAPKVTAPGTGAAKTTSTRKTTARTASKSTAKSTPRKTASATGTPAKKTPAKTTPTKSAATKPAAKKKAPAPVAAPEPAAAAPMVAPHVVSSATPTVMTEMRKEQLLDEVAKRSGAKRKDVKPIVEAALEVMGEALGEGQELNLKPLGKVKIARTKQVANGRVINLRLRQSIQVIKELEDSQEAAE